MSAAKPAEWLASTAGALRRTIVERLSAADLDEGTRSGLETALKELDLIWHQLEGHAAQLALEKERYAEFFQFAPEACLITDVGGDVREANLAALELLGAAREDLVGRPLSDYVADDEHAGVPTRKATLRESQRACQLSVRPIALKRSGVSGLCWLLRPLGDEPG